MNNKRLISLLAAAAMVASITPTNILAEEINNNVDNIIVEGTNQGSDTTVDGVGDNATDSQKPDGTEEVMPESKSPKEILKEKINNAQNGATITLESNIEMGEETLVIPQGKEIVLDLAGYTISAAKGVEKGGFTGNVIENNGTLTVKNGTVSAFNNNAGTYGSGIKNNGTLIIDEDTDKNTKVIGRTGIENFGTATVNAGIIASHNRNAYWGASTSNVVINGGIFTSPGTSGMGRAISSEGKVNINVGEFYANGESYGNENLMSSILILGENAKLSINASKNDDVKVSSKNDIAISVSQGAEAIIDGGIYTSNSRKEDILNLSGNLGKVEIISGNFSQEPSNSYLVKDSVSYLKNGRYIVEKSNEIESVDVYNYSDLASVINSHAKDPKEINIKANITIPDNEKLYLKKEFKLNLEKGKKLTVNGILSLKDEFINSGELEVTENGFIENPLNVVNKGEITGYPQIDSEGVCEISSPMQLQWISKMVEDGKTPSLIILKKDINMPQNVEFTPIGIEKSYSNSTFNALGNEINGIRINMGVEEYGGLFARVENVIIENVVIDNMNLNNKSSYVGLLIGLTNGNCSVKNITISNSFLDSNSYASSGFIGQIRGNKDTYVEFANCSLIDGTITGRSNAGVFWGTSTGFEGKIGVYDSTISGKLELPGVNGGICGGYGGSTNKDFINKDFKNVTIKGLEKNNFIAGTDKLVGYDGEINIDSTDIDSKGKVVKDESDNWIVSEEAKNIKVSINGIKYLKYPTLIEAYNVAEKYDVLKLLDNVEL